MAGTLGAAAALPVVNTLVTGGTIEQIPTLTAADQQAIAQLRAQALSTRT